MSALPHDPLREGDKDSRIKLDSGLQDKMANTFLFSSGFFPNKLKNDFLRVIVLFFFERCLVDDPDYKLLHLTQKGNNS